MVVDAVTYLDPNMLDIKLVGIKKITGGSVVDSQLIQGVAFKKTFSYAGFEQQPKHESVIFVCVYLTFNLFGDIIEFCNVNQKTQGHF